MTDQIFHFFFDKDREERLDKFLVSKLPEYSRTRLQDLIRDGFIKVNDTQVTKSGFILSSGQRVDITIPPIAPTNLQPENIELDIIFEDKNLMVINKPAGMVVHPGAGHETGTLVHAALGHAMDIEGIGGEKRPGIVHRLDKETSGLIIIAKNSLTHEWLQDQFRLRKVKKTYLALVDGKPPTPKGRIEAPIGRDTTKRKQMEIKPLGKGRSAVTEYSTIESYRSHTYIEAHPFTGRTHQIRLHLAFIGCPVVGDIVYGNRHPSVPIKRHFLHAARLEIMLPQQDQPHIFCISLPPDLEEVLNQIKRS